MRLGHIYVITNKINGKQYVGQTARALDIRFDEHCYDNRSNSLIHKAIVKYGVQNFSVELLEDVPLDELDLKEKEWINKLNTYYKGYNMTFGGQKNSFYSKYYNRIQIVENGLILDSVEELSRIMSNLTSWSVKFISSKIKKVMNKSEEDFLGYHFIEIELESLEQLSSIDEVENWVKTLNIKFTGKHIHCNELDIDFDTITQAANYLISNNLYPGKSKAPIQAVVTAISKNVRKVNNHVESTRGPLTFEYIPGTTKQSGEDTPFEKRKIHCIELNKDFDSIVEAANYFLSNKIWTGIKLKTARLRICDVARGYFPNYKGYTFKYI